MCLYVCIINVRYGEEQTVEIIQPDQLIFLGTLLIFITICSMFIYNGYEYSMFM